MPQGCVNEHGHDITAGKDISYERALARATTPVAALLDKASTAASSDSTTE